MKTKNEFENYIDSLVKNNKDILAIGETNMDFVERYGGDNISEFRFARLRKINSTIIGADYVKKNVDAAKQAGYNFVHIDIQDAKSIKKAVGNKKFDLILFLNVIEHLSNTQMAMENLRELLKPTTGRLIISTDSPYYFRQWINRILGLKIRVHTDHTAFIVPENMLQICERSKLTLVSTETAHFVKTTFASKCVAKFFNWLHPYFLDEFIYVVKRK